MRTLEQIVADNGGDNTPALDTHNLTGRARIDHSDHVGMGTWCIDCNMYVPLEAQGIPDLPEDACP